MGTCPLCTPHPRTCSQQSVSFLVPEDLDKTVGVIVALCPAVGGKWELAHCVLHTLGLEVLLVLADPGDLRVGVDDAGNAVVVDVDWTSDHALAGDDGLVLGLVGQHRSSNTVSDSVHV